MQDRLPPSHRNPLASHGRTIHCIARPDHTSGSSVVMLQPTRRFPLGPQKPTSLLRVHALVDGGFGELPEPGCFTRKAPVPSVPIALLLDVCNRRGRRIFLRLNRTT